MLRFLILLLPLLFGCVSVPMSSRPITPDVSVKKIAEVWRATYYLKVRVFYSNGVIGAGGGTCFAFSRRDGRTYLLTAAHVLRPTRYPPHLDNPNVRDFSATIDRHIMLVDGAEIRVERVLPDTDIAIISVGVRLTIYTKFYIGDLQPGMRIYGIGFPMGQHDKILAHGIVASKKHRDKFYVILSKASNPGDSGGPHFVIATGIPYLAGVASFAINGKQGLAGISVLHGTPNY